MKNITDSIFSKFDKAEDIAKAVSKAIKVVHKEDCVRVFKRYDASCPRCQELMKGLEPRKPWFIPRPQHRYIDHKDCGHNALNPGGYCNVCGNGRDFS